MKKIYIEGLGLVEGHFSGVGQYILGVLRGLDELLEEAKYAGKRTPSIQVIVPYDTVAKFRQFGFKHIGCKSFPLSFRMMSALWHRGLVPPLDLWCGRGTYIFPRFVDMSLVFSKSAALVIFDLSYELYRQYSDEKNAIFLSRGVRKSIQRADNVIAISQNAKQEIIDYYQLSPNSVSVATPATDPALFYRRSNKEIDKVKQKYEIEGDYILALSNLEPRKNLEALVDVYCRLPQSTRASTGLLIVGVSGWKTEKLINEILAKVEAGYNIMRPIKYVLDKDKPAIISGAKLLVYPSHYEGFGMPPLEALACGIPVISADNSSLPEVVGHTATLVPSNDNEKLLSAIEKALGDIENLKKQVALSGPDQVKTFSWRESAQVFLDTVQEPLK